jgi:hypothetical protein
MIIPDASETIQWDIDVSVAQPGVAQDNDTRALDNQTLGVTASQITEVDISGILTQGAGLTAGDWVAVRFQSDTLTLRMSHLWIKYS